MSFSVSAESYDIVLCTTEIPSAELGDLRRISLSVFPSGLPLNTVRNFCPVKAFPENMKTLVIIRAPSG